ncbi:unnamed protein product [Ceratitis capitata]|uniref:(Mediterranean fruit fly) hypothetical protein n=1 Tax=Ceratitis capitata TaxID=7213 RepID=A0A811VEV7_CERCA|nr:unnamed protein product [Ceratitis capitata]
MRAFEARRKLQISKENSKRPLITGEKKALLNRKKYHNNNNKKQKHKQIKKMRNIYANICVAYPWNLQLLLQRLKLPTTDH